MHCSNREGATVAARGVARSTKEKRSGSATGTPRDELLKAFTKVLRRVRIVQDSIEKA